MAAYTNIIKEECTAVFQLTLDAQELAFLLHLPEYLNNETNVCFSMTLTLSKKYLNLLDGYAAFLIQTGPSYNYDCLTDSIHSQMTEIMNNPVTELMQQYTLTDMLRYGIIAHLAKHPAQRITETSGRKTGITVCFNMTYRDIAFLLNVDESGIPETDSFCKIPVSLHLTPEQSTVLLTEKEQHEVFDCHNFIPVRARISQYLLMCRNRPFSDLWYSNDTTFPSITHELRASLYRQLLLL